MTAHDDTSDLHHRLIAFADDCLRDSDAMRQHSDIDHLTDDEIRRVRVLVDHLYSTAHYLFTNIAMWKYVPPCHDVSMEPYVTHSYDDNTTLVEWIDNLTDMREQLHRMGHRVRDMYQTNPDRSGKEYFIDIVESDIVDVLAAIGQLLTECLTITTMPSYIEKSRHDYYTL